MTNISLKEKGRQILEASKQKAERVKIDGFKPQRGLWLACPERNKVYGQIMYVKRNGNVVWFSDEYGTNIETEQEKLTREGQSYKYYSSRPDWHPKKRQTPIEAEHQELLEQLKQQQQQHGGETFAVEITLMSANGTSQEKMTVMIDGDLREPILDLAKSKNSSIQKVVSGIIRDSVREGRAQTLVYPPASKRGRKPKA